MKLLFSTILLWVISSYSLIYADSYSEALTHYKTGNMQAALTTIEKAIKEKNSAAAHELKGRALNKTGKTEPALQEFKTAIELEPKRASVHFFVGEVLFREEQWTDAFKSYRYALELDPEYKNSILKMVYCLIVTENYPIAHQWLTTLDPTSELKPDYYFARAVMAIATDKPEEYISALRQARTIYSTQIFNRYEPDMLRVVHKIKARQKKPEA